MIASLCFGAVAVGLAAWIYRGMTTFTPLPPMRQLTDVLLPVHACVGCEWARLVAATGDDWLAAEPDAKCDLCAAADDFRLWAKELAQ